MALLKSVLKKEKSFAERTVFHKSLMVDISAKGKVVSEGGGKKAIEKLHSQNKLHCRERINLLIDKNTSFLEIGLFTAYDMYKEYGGAPSSGTIFGIGKVSDRDCVIVANDATVKARALEMGLVSQGSEMSLAAKQAATLSLIMEQSGAAQGQASREADGASGSMRQLQTEIKN